jgi:glycosyltransferase involved in cell wall biosynthesis
MKIALYEPYLNIIGGGERYLATIAEHLSTKNDVFLFWDKNTVKKMLENQLGINLSKVQIINNVFTPKISLFTRLRRLRKFDKLIYLSDGSIPFVSSKTNFLLFLFPVNWLNGKTLINQIKIKQFKKVISISNFTKGFIDKTFGIKSVLIYPPVDTERFLPLPKENIILSVGRFTKSLHNKKQEVLVEAFKRLVDSGVNNWKLMIVGGVTEDEKYIVDNLNKMKDHYHIEIKTDIDLNELTKLYGSASIFWHASGFGIDENINPEKVEHFGISTIEAMSAGCVPVVAKKGGQKEIIEENISGLFFETVDELVKKTKMLIVNQKERESLSQKAIMRSKYFSKEQFTNRIDSIIES